MGVENVSKHYAIGDLERRILAALEADGKDLDALTVDDLAPVDEFHIRGRKATEELASWADLQEGHTLLDVGCGLGGTSRYLASTRGCEVVGLDLTEEYCQIAERLSARVGLAERTAFQQGSALEMPFSDGSFDVVWTEHVQMNIEDKTGFYGEMGRVLKRDGRLVFHDIFAGDGEALHFPVPWAGDGSISHLIGVEEVQRLLADLDLEPVRWEDRTKASETFFRAALRVHERPSLGLHLLMGEDAPKKFGNVLRNLEEGRLRVMAAVMRRSDS